jgi:uncharacterized protein YfaS (alpha-2-macroglobulin family)
MKKEYFVLMFRQIKKNLFRLPLKTIIPVGLVLLFIILVVADYFATLRVVEISELNNLDAYAGVVKIRYNKPAARVHYKPENTELTVKSSLSKDGLTEIHSLVYPTRFNETHIMRLDIRGEDFMLIGLSNLSPETLTLTTAKEKIYVKELIPAENSNPSPETFDNQLAIRFSGDIIGKYKKEINIPVHEMKYVKLIPEQMGYYRWSGNSLLTFNFTEDKPRFETTYEFEIFPKTFVDPTYREWVAERTKYRVTTSANDVYVSDFSPVGNVNWQTPLRIEFSGNMVGALDVLKKKSQALVPVTISPKAGGVWVWVNARTLEFQPDNFTGLPAKKTVIVTIRPEINREPDRKWRSGQKPVEYSFYVEPRKQYIKSYNLRGDSVALEEDLTVTFSRPMVDVDMLHKPFAHEPVTKDTPLLISPQIKGNFYWINQAKLKFHPDKLWSQLTGYKVRLNPGYKQDPLYEWTGTTDFTFKTVENVVHANYFFTPENRLSATTFFSGKKRYKKSKDIEPQSQLWILFDRDLGSFVKRDMDLSEGFVIKPAVKGKFTWLSNNLIEFVPGQNWKEKTNYSLKLTKKLLHHPEQHFYGNEDSFTFSTGKNRVRCRQITKFSPGKKTTIHHDPVNPFDIDFSRNMNTIIKVGRVYKMSEIKPGSLPVTIVPAIAASINWQNNRLLTIQPEGYWQPDTLYTITLNPRILPQAASKFEAGNLFYIHTDKNRYSIGGFTPRGKVGRRIIIDVEFSRNIKPAHIKPGGKDSDRLFSVSPAIKGDWVWLTASKLQFKPTEPLKPATSYTVAFDPNKVRDKRFTWHIDPEAGQEKYSPDEYGFFTPALYVVKTGARFDFNKKDILKQRFFLDIELSEPVDARELRRHFSIWYDKYTKKSKTTIQVPLLYKLQAKQAAQGIRKFSIVSDWIDRPAADRKIEYKITGGLNPLEGNLTLSDDYTGYFYQEKPKHIRFTQVKWQWSDRRYRAILSFNAPIEAEVLRDFLTVKKGGAEGETPLHYEVSVDKSGRRGDFKYEVIADFFPGISYNFYIAEGLMAADGAFAADAINQTLLTPDLATKLEFALSGSFLSKKDLASIPVLTANIDSFYIIIDKIFANNVDYFINNRIDSAQISDIAENVINRQYYVRDIVGRSDTRNQTVTTHIDIAELLKSNVHGLFRIGISTDSYLYNRSAANSRWFLATDIGLMARRFDNNLVIWAHSLHSLQEMAGVKVEAVDRWNQVIGAAITDSNGLARVTFNEGTQPTHILAKKGDDFSLLDMGKHRDSLAGYDIEGISSAQSAIRTFIYSDRGVYRPGEKVHLIAVSRAKEGALPEDWPVTFRLLNPTGKQVVSESYTLDKNGLFVYDFDIPREAKTGKWQATAVWAGDNIGNYSFQVEEFIPNKIKVNLELLTKNVYAGDKLKFKVKAKNLFGPPAADRPASAAISLRPNYFKPAGYGSFTFGHDDNRFQRLEKELAEIRLKTDGTHIFEYDIPGNIDSPIGLTAYYSAAVIDNGGRGVTAYGSADVLLFSQYAGVAKLTKGVIDIDQPVTFKIVNVDATGKPIEAGQQKLSITVYRNKMITHYRKNERGYYRYVMEKEKVLVDTLADSRDSEGRLSYTPGFSGEHIFEVEDLIGKQVTRYRFDVYGKAAVSRAVAAGDKVELSLLTGKTCVNDTAKVEVCPPFPGKVLIIGEREKILFTRVLDVTGSKEVISIPIRPSYLPNFYISAIALRPVSKGSRNEPIYSAGLLAVDVKDKAHEPGCRLTVPKRAVPNSELAVSIEVANTNGKDMFFTVAAVDVGILDLTNFQLPNMNGYFNQKRRLEVSHYSMYPLVMPFEPGVKYTISPSGDAPSRSLIKKKSVNPDSQKRVKSVALWSGLLKLDARGEGTVKLKIPDFNGTLRVMAVTFGDRRFASRQKEVVVRDKLVMKPTLPRFMTTGDDFIIPVTLYNGTDRAGDIRLSIKASGQVKFLGPVQRTVFIPYNGEAAVDFSLKVGNRTEICTFELTVEGNGETVHKQVQVPVRSPGTVITETGCGVVDKNTPKSVGMPGGFVAGTAEYAMKVSDRSLTRFRNSLAYLLQYPHGCAEQTTSKLFPLLYFSDLAKSAGKIFTAKKGPKYYLKEGIAKLERMQLENGAFSYWEGQNNVNNWASVYVSHFLVEAQKAGFKIDEDVWGNMMVYLKRKAGESLSRSNLYNRNYGVNHSLYMLYVLALAGNNVQPELNYIYDSYFSELKTHDRARLAAAFFTAGNKETAHRIVAALPLDSLGEYDNLYRDTGGHFASTIRDLAIILDTLVTVAPKSSKIPTLISRLAEKARGGRWGSTQENAFAFLAIGKAMAHLQAVQAKVKITLGDGTVVPFKGEVFLKTAELLKGEVRIEVDGNAEVAYAYEAVGIIKNPESLQQDKDIRVRRRFLNSKGDPIDYGNVTQGDLLVAEIKIESLSHTHENIIIGDLLPMGLEIENTRLSTTASLPWIKQDIKPDYLDIRDDRINIYLTAPTAAKTYYYTTRAVTVGNFKIPAIRAEAMYDPGIYSEADSGKIKIMPKEGRKAFALELEK